MQDRAYQQAIQEIQQRLAVIETKQKNDHGRIDENKALIKPLTTQMERLTTSIEHLIDQVKGSNERMGKMAEKIDESLRGQGERIGDHDTAIERLTVISEKLIKRMDSVESDVDELKTKGSRRLDSIKDGIIGKVICVGIGVIIPIAFFILYRLGL